MHKKTATATISKTSSTTGAELTAISHKWLDIGKLPLAICHL
jgi:hypothetical protein